MPCETKLHSPCWRFHLFSSITARFLVSLLVENEEKDTNLGRVSGIEKGMGSGKRWARKTLCQYATIVNRGEAIFGGLDVHAAGFGLTSATTTELFLDSSSRF